MSTQAESTGSEPGQGVTDALGRLSFEVMGRLSKLAAEEDMSLTQLRMLAILRDRTPRMAELADALGIDRSSVTGLIARAEKRGLVARKSTAGDGRGVSVALTPAGHAFATPAAERIDAELEPLLSNLNPTERQRLETLLDKIMWT